MAKNFDDLLAILAGKPRPLWQQTPDLAPTDATQVRTTGRAALVQAGQSAGTGSASIGGVTKGNAPAPETTVQSRYRPRYDKAINLAIDNLPPVFAARNGMEAAHQLNAGHYGSAAATAALTFLTPDEIPGVGNAIKRVAGRLPASALLRDVGEMESVGTNAKLLQEADRLKGHPALYTAAGPYGALPTPAPGHPEVQSILREMQASSGGRNLPRVTSVDPERGRAMARAYAQLPTNDPAARGAYDALNAEVAAQKKRLEDAGFSFEMVDHDPYKSSKEMMADVAATKRLKVYKTQGDQAHPFMTNDQNNDFRGVHDLLAHAGEGHQFGPKGEENAYRVHASTLSPAALPALAAETRGQNSFVNFGPNAHLPVGERPFAPQKAALFPDHLLGDYHEMGAGHAIPRAGEEYGILTAENPNGTALDPAANAQRNQALEQELTKRGHTFTPVRGQYTDPDTKQTLNENSYLVHGLSAPHAEELGRLFGQNGVVTHQGYHDLAAGTLHPTSGLSSTKDIPFTELPDGQRFTSGIDWSKSTPIVKSAAERDAEGAGLRVVGDSTAAHGVDWAAKHAVGYPEQKDLPRLVKPRVPQSRVDDIEHEAFKTYTGPEFEQWLKDGNFGDWYHTQPTEQKAVDALGDTEGPDGFRRLMEMMGATTARSDPGNNLRRAGYYRGLENAGLLDNEALRTAGYKKVPTGMGHLANNAHHSGLAGLLESGAIDPLQNPKPAGFVENLSRNMRPFTNDTRMATGAALANPKLLELGAIIKSVGKDGGVTYSPRDWAYAPMERAAQKAAEHHAGRGLFSVPTGVSPTADFQAKVWDGLSPVIKGASPSQGTFNDVFNAKLTANAKAWGVSEDEANKLFWAGHPFDIPLNKDVVPGGLLGRYSGKGK